MGSIQSLETAKYAGRRPGKVDAHLAAQLDAVEWGEFRLCELFEKIKIKALKYKAKDLPNEPTGDFVLPALTAGIQNQGLNNFVPRTNATILRNVISISANGANTGATFYQKDEFTVLQDAYAIRWIYSEDKLTDRQYLYITACISSVIYGSYEWTNKAGWERIKEKNIQLPLKNNLPNLDFMENFVSELEARRTAELEAYLSAAGLKDCTLTVAEEQALAKLKEGKKEFAPFSFDSVFNQIKQGRRLKKDDQISGSIPFVMAGVTNTGVVGYIANPVAQFPKNSITLDIFGNAFYRNYDYGAGDDTGAYWHDEQDFSKETMLFLTAAMQKAVSGKFSYGKKLRSSQSLKIKMQLPSLNGTPDYAFMQTLLSAVQKLVIRDVVEYADNKITATQTVIQQNGKEAV